VSLRFLLDEQISPHIEQQMASKRPDILVASISTWHEGFYLGATDEQIFIAAAAESSTLVTYDQKTIAPLLIRWGDSGRAHGGVVFIDNRTIPSSNFGALLKALTALWDVTRNDNWNNRTIYLQLP
jgi:predicted nuclease of predicted toxin-antitoxin system